MTFDPASILSDDEKLAIVDQRAKQWATEAFSHQLNREAVSALPDSGGKAEQLSQIDAALSVLTKSVQGAVAKGEALKAVKADTAAQREAAAGVKG